MTIEVVNPEIIDQENFIPTAIDNLFVNPETKTAVIVGYYIAFKIFTK